LQEIEESLKKLEERSNCLKLGFLEDEEILKKLEQRCKENGLRLDKLEQSMKIISTNFK